MSALSLATGGVFLFLLAHGEALFAELSSMQPSASSLERLPKGLLARWEAHLRTSENIPRPRRPWQFRYLGKLNLGVPTDVERGQVAA